MGVEKNSAVGVFRDRVTLLSKELGMTQERFAEHCGLQHSDISNLSRKKQIPTDVMLAVADKCNVSTDWLFGRTDIREVAQTKEENKADFDYSKVTYGDLNRILAFAAACGVLQIVHPKNKNDTLTLMVKDEDTALFLRKLQEKAIDVITDADETEFLTAWFAKKCDNSLTLSTVGLCFGIQRVFAADKYHGAFPWNYLASIGYDFVFNFTGAEWTDDSPADYQGLVWYDDGEHSDIHFDYDPYKCLYDGITGYYRNIRGIYLDPPCAIKNDSQPDTSDFTNIPNSTDDELPFN